MARIAQVQAAARRGVDVGDVVEVDTMRARISQTKNGALGQTPLDSQIPGFRIGGLYVLIDGALADRRQRLGSRARQRAGVVRIHRHGGNIRPCNQTDHGIVRRVLDRVEGYVAEVALVADGISAAHAGGAVAEYVVREAEVRPKVLIIGLPENTAVLGEFH